MGLDAGRLRNRVAIQQVTNAQNTTTGEITRTWATIATVWASVEPLSVREFLQSKTDQSGVAARITIRHRAGLDASMRILHGTTIYSPAGFLADKDSGTEYLTIPCTQGVNEG